MKFKVVCDHCGHIQEVCDYKEEAEATARMFNIFREDSEKMIVVESEI